MTPERQRPEGWALRSELHAEIQALHDLVAALALDVDRLGRRVQRLEVDPNA